MTTDILADLGYLALGSRLKRLAERLQSDAALIHGAAGMTMQPGQFPLIAAIDRHGALTVNEAVEALGVSQPAVTRTLAGLLKLGLVQTEQSESDRRQKTITLTEGGRRAVDQMKTDMWPRVEAAARDICAGLEGDFLSQLASIEARIAETSLAARVHRGGLSIVEYSDDLAKDFYDINAEWIRSMFRLEDHDIHVLSHPRETIIEPGGDILFVEALGLGIVGTCALQTDDHGYVELTKMGVLESARGQKAGEFLLRAALAQARVRQFDKLYLVTNWKCASAIHLYEKLGFEHDEEIMDLFGKRYERCDVAMRYCG